MWKCHPFMQKIPHEGEKDIPQFHMEGLVASPNKFTQTNRSSEKSGRWHNTQKMQHPMLISWDPPMRQVTKKQPKWHQHCAGPQLIQLHLSLSFSPGIWVKGLYKSPWLATSNALIVSRAVTLSRCCSYKFKPRAILTDDIKIRGTPWHYCCTSSTMNRIKTIMLQEKRFLFITPSAF